MRSFREFLTEVSAASTLTGAGGVTFNNLDVENDPSAVPYGGWSSITDKTRAQMKQNLSPEQKQILANQEMLQKFQLLAKEAAAAIDNRTSGNQNNNYSYSYSSAQWVDSQKTKMILSLNDIEGGRSPNIKSTELEWGKSQGIFIPDRGNFIFDLKVLAQASQNLVPALSKLSRENQAKLYAARSWDNALGRLRNAAISTGSTGEVKLRVPTVQ